MAALVSSIVAGQALSAEARSWAVSADPSSQNAQTKENKVRFATVMIQGKEIMRLAETEELHADERAAEAEKRLKMAMVPSPGEKFQPIKASDVTVEPVGNAVVVRLRNQNVAQATPQDAKLADMTPEELAQRWAEDLRSSLKSIKAAKGGKLPNGWVAVAKGEMTMPQQEAGTKPKGGGAGTAPEE